MPAPRPDASGPARAWRLLMRGMRFAPTRLVVVLGALLVAGPGPVAAELGDLGGGTCEERCLALGHRVGERCLAAGIGVDRCEALGTEVTRRCTAAHCDPAVPSCERPCLAEAADGFEACIEGGGDVVECATRARERAATCIAEQCRPEPPPTCEERCAAFARAAGERCV